MQTEQPQVVVAGHICLDIIPSIPPSAGDLRSLFVPGKLVDVGAAEISTGGAVSNAGLALHRLGVPTALMGKVGDDILGRAILDFLRRHDPRLADGMIVAAGEPSSYTIVISPPGVDRIFLHCPGANDTFGAADVACDRLGSARLFHFGYPPLMRRLFADGGVELSRLLAEVKARGLTTSLDLARPDPNSPAGKADWVALLGKVLPHVDVFLPSLDEILYMIDRPRLERMQRQGGDDIMPQVDGEVLADISSRLLGMGCRIVVLKLGEHGLYLRTAADAAALSRMGRSSPGDANEWAGREMLAPCFEVKVAGTTGSGDCTIAGFLLGLLRGFGPAEAMTAAVAVGACNVERPDSVSGIVPWPRVQERIQSGWGRHPNRLRLDGWRWDEPGRIWLGPNDQIK